ncbi:MAG: hypothetical protein K8T10_07315 [Candidatus Eremiobacteraeota bacterium]|nr:hypothetical protein [Candidatus Eremiobacteraeota bacterium]
MIDKSNAIAGHSARVGPGNILASKKKKAPALPKDTVEISDGKQEPVKRPLPSKMARMARKGIAKISGTACGAVTAVTNIPLGMIEAGNRVLHPEKDIATRKKGIINRSTRVNTVAGAAIGCVAFGPVGLVVGAAMGYIQSTISRYLDSKAHVTDNLIDKVDKKVDETIQNLPNKEDSSKFRKLINATVQGGIEASKEGWRSGKVIGAGSGAGLLSGGMFIARDMKDSIKDIHQSAKEEMTGKPKNGESKSIMGKMFEVGMGIVCGVSGVIINVPGGAIEGALQSVERGSERKEMTRPLLLFSTNAGKIIPPAIVGAAIGGPVGAAAGTAVGMVSGSLTTIIDGKYGFNKQIVRQIDKAIDEVVEDTGNSSEGYSVYHNSAKGTLVGAYAGLKEGWRVGYKGGKEFARGVFDAPTEVVKKEEE